MYNIYAITLTLPTDELNSHFVCQLHAFIQWHVIIWELYIHMCAPCTNVIAHHQKILYHLYNVYGLIGTAQPTNDTKYYERRYLSQIMDAYIIYTWCAFQNNSYTYIILIYIYNRYICDSVIEFKSKRYNIKYVIKNNDKY